MEFIAKDTFDRRLGLNREEARQEFVGLFVAGRIFRLLAGRSVWRMTIRLPDGELATVCEARTPYGLG